MGRGSSPSCSHPIMIMLKIMVIMMVMIMVQMMMTIKILCHSWRHRGSWQWSRTSGAETVSCAKQKSERGRLALSKFCHCHVKIFGGFVQSSSKTDNEPSKVIIYPKKVSTLPQLWFSWLVSGVWVKMTKVKPVEDIQLLDQELDAGGDEQVGEVVAVDLQQEHHCHWLLIG